MITRVNPNFLMGKIRQDDTFYRVNQSSSDLHHDKILRYGCGLYFVFETKSIGFTIKYKCHFNESPLRFSKKQMVECSVMGFDKSTNEWYYLNSLSGFTPTDGKSNDVFEVELEIKREFDRYQVVLPENGCSSDFIIESEEPIIFEYIDNQIVLLGSSVSQFCNDCNHMNLCAYMYRKYGLNVATIGISGFHTFHNSCLMDDVKDLKNRMIVLSDLEHCQHTDYERYRDWLKDNVIYLVIDSLSAWTCRKIKKTYDEIYSILPKGSWMYDSRHLNDYGIVEYSNLIFEKYNEYKKQNSIK